MREIKFRGKGLKDGKWYYGDLVSGDRMIDYDDEDTMDYMYMDGSGVIDGRAKMIDEKTIGQYTGLKDRNGKEIYEGDILQDDEKFLWEIKYKPGCFRVECNRLMARGLIIDLIPEKFKKVIGNIYDNPELLE